ncbi:MAG: 5'/3'-nucleotidase SurE [Ardenticatenia bacterium]|jgi:5'-nucleotidase|nr:MAG: 5'/3'-nucleotidase SurE [Ardenticatenia bacterium]
MDTTAANRTFAYVASLRARRDAARPLILITNDDGIASPGLYAAVRAVSDLGEVVVVAPRQQFSNASRCHPPSAWGHEPGPTERIALPADCPATLAYAVDGSPAQAVARAWIELLNRLPDLVISGINYGENLGSGTTVSGTVGAAIEAACVGIPALAVSLQTHPDFYYHPSEQVDFRAAAHFTRMFAQAMLAGALPADVDILKVDVPADATPETPWRVTRVSRQPYYVPVIPRERGIPDYRIEIDLETLEPDSDIYALVVARAVSVCPLSIDLSSRVDRQQLCQLLAERTVARRVER